MVMMLVIAIIMSVGVPQMSVFFKGNRMVANTNDLIGGLGIARSESIKRNNRVTICKSKTATAVAPTCDATAEWHDGWFVFEEGTDIGNSIGEFTATDNQNILRVNAGAEGVDTTITTIGYADIEDFVTFSSRGLPVMPNGNAASGVFMVCDDRGLKNYSSNVVANGVVLLASGRVGATKVEAQIGVCP